MTKSDLGTGLLLDGLGMSYRLYRIFLLLDMDADIWCGMVSPMFKCLDRPFWFWPC